MSRFQALFHKELLRFWKVAVQTVAAPVLTAVLYLPVLVHGGSALLTQNRFVKPLSWPEMVAQTVSFARLSLPAARWGASTPG